mmetsp:Transcript_117452/g.328805  ORF Transcript_117452/g.328805 Transcript_117452/m.328805 type:complete len:291 (+) Transcript_117452:958-1830(+)
MDCQSTCDGTDQDAHLRTHDPEINRGSALQHERADADRRNRHQGRDHARDDVAPFVDELHGSAPPAVRPAVRDEHAEDDGCDDDGQQVVLRGVLHEVARNEVVRQAHGRLQHAPPLHRGLPRGLPRGLLVWHGTQRRREYERGHQACLEGGDDGGCQVEADRAEAHAPSTREGPHGEHGLDQAQHDHGEDDALKSLQPESPGQCEHLNPTRCSQGKVCKQGADEDPCGHRQEQVKQGMPAAMRTLRLALLCPVGRRIASAIRINDPLLGHSSRALNTTVQGARLRPNGGA